VDIEQQGRAIRPLMPAFQFLSNGFNNQQSQSYNNPELSNLITTLLDDLGRLDRKNYYVAPP
jgi:hypothetical protein